MTRLPHLWDYDIGLRLGQILLLRDGKNPTDPVLQVVQRRAERQERAIISQRLLHQ